MNTILKRVDTIGLKTIQRAIRQRLISRAGRKSVVRLEVVLKTGEPSLLRRERRAYAQCARLLTQTERRILFPNVVLKTISPRDALLAIEPVGNRTLEDVVLETVAIAKTYGWYSKAVQIQQNVITLLTQRVLQKLAILHRPVRGIAHCYSYVKSSAFLVTGLQKPVFFLNVS